MKTVHCSTDEFVEKMESYKFIRTSLYSGVMCGVEYTTTEPPELKTLDDFLSLEYSDVELVDYDPHPDFKDKPPMAV